MRVRDNYFGEILVNAVRYYHDDGNRTENINCLNKIFDIDIDIDTMISQLEKPRIRISKRPNPRSDEY